MAGTSPDFNGAEFRTAIRGVFNMAAPPITADQARFYFPNQLVYNTSAVDGSGVPFDPIATVTRTVLAPITVACGIEYRDNRDQPTAFGDVVPASVLITVLDEDFVKIDGFSYVVLHGEKFKLTKVRPPSGLFDVGIYEFECTNENA